MTTDYLSRPTQETHPEMFEHYVKGRNFFEDGNAAYAKAAFEESLKHTDRLSAYQYQDVMTYLAFCHIDIGNPDKGLQTFLDTETVLTRAEGWQDLTDLEILFPEDFESSRDGRLSMGRLYDTLAITHDQQGKVDEAVKYFGLAIEQYREVGDLSAIANTITFAVTGHEKREEWSAVVEGATHILQIADRLAQSGNPNPNIALTGWQMMAHAHYRLGNLSEAETYQEKVVAYLQKINHEEISKFELFLAQIKLDIKNKLTLT